MSASIGRENETTTVFLPYCLGSSAPRYTVQEDDNLWNIYQAEFGTFSGIDTWEAYLAECERLNGAGACDKLTPGATITLPTNDLVVTVPEELASSLVQDLQQIELIGNIEIQRPLLSPLDSADEALAQDPSCTSDTEFESLRPPKSCGV